MACYTPITGWKSRQINPNGKRSVVFKRELGYLDMEVQVPCGQCIGCRLDRSLEWALRCMHEAQMHRENSFITLTYNNDNIPLGETLVKKDFQDFMKRYRKSLGNKKIRYYQCGEYGAECAECGNSLFTCQALQRRKEIPPHKQVETIGRPHYHAIIFGHQMEDQKLFREKNGVKLYTSEKLEKLWGKGFVTTGEVTFQSAAYVARYVVKKITGEKAEEHYRRVDKRTGEIFDLLPEYTEMSRGGTDSKGRKTFGIAREWFEKYKNDLRKDYITVGGKKYKPPKYYDDLWEIYDIDHYESMKGKRRKAAKENTTDKTPDRKEQRENVKIAQSKFLKREL